ncbi:cupin domain-containing protein [Nocardioides rubriscoriae]|uniref:cupin domain-containing protein n=1 Tax=Nocardioides rubriscoriae TaxID=642762 RepID=UPI0011DF4DD1|nr:cupin domain-containing protein [Nocardioides rubriscoriae]
MNLLTTLAGARVTETPAAAMRTYASPSADSTADVSVWRTEMKPDTSGPVHVIDTDHVVVVLEGSLRATVDGATVEAGAGDCVLLPRDAERQLVAGPQGVVTLTAAQPGSTARAGDADPVRVPWAS